MSTKIDEKILTENVYFELYLRIYVLGREIGSMVKEHNADRLTDVVTLAMVQRKKMTISELAEGLAIKPSAMSQKVKRLVEMGHVTVARADDKRHKEISITKSGVKYLTQVIEEVHGECLRQKRAVEVSEGQARQVVEILKKL